MESDDQEIEEAKKDERKNKEEEDKNEEEEEQKKDKQDNKQKYDIDEEITNIEECNKIHTEENDNEIYDKTTQTFNNNEEENRISFETNNLYIKELKFKEKISLNPKEIFIIKEEIKFSDLILKLKNFYSIFFLFFEYKRQYPDFESNYFFFLQIKYLLDTILYLNEAAFGLKILDLVDNEKLIKLIKANKVTEERYVDYFYYEICEEYQLDIKVLNSIKNCL